MLFSPHPLEPRGPLGPCVPSLCLFSVPCVPPRPCSLFSWPLGAAPKEEKVYGLSRLSLVPGYLLYTYPSGLDAPPTQRSSVEPATHRTPLALGAQGQARDPTWAPCPQERRRLCSREFEMSGEGEAFEGGM